MIDPGLVSVSARVPPLFFHNSGALHHSLLAGNGMSAQGLGQCRLARSDVFVAYTAVHEGLRNFGDALALVHSGRQDFLDLRMALQLHKLGQVLAPGLRPSSRALRDGAHDKLCVGLGDILRGQRSHVPGEVLPEEVKELVGGRVALFDRGPYLLKILLQVDPIFERVKNIVSFGNQHNGDPVF